MARITRIETFAINYPVAGRFKFFENPAGVPLGRPAVVVKITANDGTVGWGQSVPSPRWSYETLESVRTTLDRHLAPQLIGLDPFDEPEIARRLRLAIAPSFSTGQPIAKAGLDLALFDLTGRLLGQSAAARWQRPTNSPVTLSWTLNPKSGAEAEESIARAHARGYRHFNLKVAPELATDLALCRLVRRLAPDGDLWVDANGGYDEDTAVAAATAFADLGVKWFEQPVPANHLRACARLKRHGALPIILDEPLVSLTDLREFHELGLLDGAAIKVARCGGVTEARRQVGYLLEHGLIFLGSGLTDPDLSLAASLNLYSAYALPHPAALNGPQFLTDTILAEPLPSRGDQIHAPAGIGLGVEVDEAKLHALALT